MAQVLQRYSHIRCRPFHLAVGSLFRRWDQFSCSTLTSLEYAIPLPHRTGLDPADVSRPGRCAGNRRRWRTDVTGGACGSSSRPFVAISFAAPAVSGGAGFFNLSAVCRSGYRTTFDTSFLSIATRCSISRSSFWIFSLLRGGPVQNAGTTRLCNETELTVFLAKRVFQRSDTGEIVVIHNRFYNAVMILQRSVGVKADIFGGASPAYRRAWQVVSG